MYKFIAILVSFSIAAACANFDINNSADMAVGVTSIALQGGSVQLSGNPVVVICNTTTSGFASHKLLIKTTRTDASNPGGPWIDSIPPLAGQAVFDIAALVETSFDYNITRTDAVMVEHEALAANITVQVGETYIDGTGATVTTWGDSVDLIALKGGLSSYEYAIMHQRGDTFFSSYIENRSFLTRLPSVKTSNLFSYEKLWFLVPEAAAFDITLVAYFDNGTSTTDTYTRPGGYQPGKMYELTIMPHQVYFPNWVDGIGTGARCTQVVVNFDRVFVYPEVEPATITEFYYVNQLSGVDLLICTGDLSYSAETSGDSYTTGLPTSPVPTNGTIVPERKTIAKKYKCNSGYLKSEDERKAFVDFLSSDKVWWKTGEFGRLEDDLFGLIPIRILPGSFLITDTDEYHINIEFEFEIAFVDKYI